jgi:hypothetical protein
MDGPSQLVAEYADCGVPICSEWNAAGFILRALLPFIRSGPACLPRPLSYALSSPLSVIFIHALGREMAQLMGNASHQLLKIPEHTGREINSPALQAGESKFGFVCMKGIAHVQEFLVFENDNAHPFIGIWGVAKFVVCCLNQADEKPFLQRDCPYDDWVSRP